MLLGGLKGLLELWPYQQLAAFGALSSILWHFADLDMLSFELKKDIAAPVRLL